MAKRKGTRTRYPGVRRISAGRYHIHVKAVSWKTGKAKEQQGEIECDGTTEAAAIRAQWKAEIEGKAEGVRRLRFVTFCKSWIEQKGPEVKESTARTYAHVAVILIRHLGDYYIDAITAQDLALVRAAMRKTSKPVTVNRQMKVAHQIFKAAVDQRLIDVSPLATIKNLPDHDRPVKGWPADTVACVLEAIRKQQPQWFDHCYLLATTGLRWGELAGLRWDDIDDANAVIHIRRAYWDGKDQMSTKTGKARDVPLPPALAEVLHQRRQRMIQEQHPRLASGLVFPTRRSDAKSPAIRHSRVLNDAIRPVLDSLGLKGTAHWFRHSFNDMIRRATHDPVVVQAITGHTSLGMTIHYSNVDRAEKAKLSAHVVRLIRSGTGGGTNGAANDGHADP